MNGYTILGATSSSSSTEDAKRTTMPSIPPTPPPTTNADARAAALAYLHSLVGTPYVWGSKDPKVGLDCSGAYVVPLEHAGLALPGARYRYGSADLHQKLLPTSDPKPGDAVFYGAGGKVSHVMMWVGDGRVLGATGGGPKTKTADDARAIGAYVKYKDAGYRKDVVGYGQAPSASAPLPGKKGTRLETSEAREEESGWIAVGLAVVLAAVGGIGTWWLMTRSAR